MNEVRFWWVFKLFRIVGIENTLYWFFKRWKKKKPTNQNWPRVVFIVWLLVRNLQLSLFVKNASHMQLAGELHLSLSHWGQWSVIVTSRHSCCNFPYFRAVMLRYLVLSPVVSVAANKTLSDCSSGWWVENNQSSASLYLKYAALELN